MLALLSLLVERIFSALSTSGLATDLCVVVDGAN